MPSNILADSKDGFCDVNLLRLALPITYHECSDSSDGNCGIRQPTICSTSSVTAYWRKSKNPPFAVGFLRILRHQRWYQPFSAIQRNPILLQQDITANCMLLNFVCIPCIIVKCACAYLYSIWFSSLLLMCSVFSERSALSLESSCIFSSILHACTIPDNIII